MGVEVEEDVRIHVAFYGLRPSCCVYIYSFPFCLFAISTRFVGFCTSQKR